jgi:hypothetical protein
MRHGRARTELERLEPASVDEVDPPSSSSGTSTDSTAPGSSAGGSSGRGAGKGVAP